MKRASMNFEKFQNKLKTVVILSGIGVTFLYIIGYTSERVFWNSIGLLKVPTNHLEFLYRGGNVILGALADLLTFPQLLFSQLSNFSIITLLLIIGVVFLYLSKKNIIGNFKYKVLSILSIISLMGLATLALTVFLYLNWPAIHIGKSFPKAIVTTEMGNIFYKQIIIVLSLTAFYVYRDIVNSCG
jgi:hypothetical protein